MSRSPITEDDLGTLCAALMSGGTTAVVAYSYRAHATVVHDEPTKTISSIIDGLGLPFESINEPGPNRSGRIVVWSDGR